MQYLACNAKATNMYVSSCDVFKLQILMYTKTIIYLSQRAYSTIDDDIDKT